VPFFISRNTGHTLGGTGLCTVLACGRRHRRWLGGLHVSMGGVGGTGSGVAWRDFGGPVMGTRLKTTRGARLDG